MKQTLHQAFQCIKEQNPPLYLESVILQKIELEKNKQMKRKLILSYAGFIFSLSALLYIGIYSGSSFLKSDFWNLLSLFFSDVTVVGQHWKDFIFSLLENFPFMHAIAILIPIFTLLMSLNLVMSMKNKVHNIVSH